MIYILDTNIIRKLLFHFPKKGKIFEDIWAKLEAGIEEGKYISVDECFNELSGQFSKDNEAFKWISERKHMFKNPDSAETLLIRELFKDRKMRESIHTKNILANRHLLIYILLQRPSNFKRWLLLPRSTSLILLSCPIFVKSWESSTLL